MRNTILAGSLLLMLAVPAFAADEKKKGDAKKADDVNPASKQEYDIVRQAGEATGRVRKLGSADRSFTLDIEYSVPDPRDKDGKAEAQAENLVRDQQRLLSKQQQILATRDPITRQLRLQQLYAEMSRVAARELGNIKLAKQHRSFSVQGVEGVQVRVTEMPPRFDDKGNVVPYTAQELKDLKGKGNAPGFPFDFNDLDEGQMVKVTLAKRKKDDKVPDDQLQAATILVIHEAGSDKKVPEKRPEKKK